LSMLSPFSFLSSRYSSKRRFEKHLRRPRPVLVPAGGIDDPPCLRWPFWPREVGKVVDLLPAGSLGPSFLGSVSWRWRLAGRSAPHRNKSLRPRSRRVGVCSGTGVRPVRVSSLRFGSFRPWWVCIGAWIVWSVMRRLVLWSRLPRLSSGDGAGGGAASGVMAKRRADRASLASIHGQGGVGRVPGRWTSSVFFFPSQGAGYYCGSCQSHGAMRLLLAWAWRCSSPDSPGVFFVDDDDFRRWQPLLARTERPEGSFAFLFFSRVFSVGWRQLPPLYPCSMYLYLYVSLIF